MRGRPDVAANRIFLQGWSNGGSTALNVMTRQGANAGFRAALVFYPGCGREALLESTVATTAPEGTGAGLVSTLFPAIAK